MFGADIVFQIDQSNIFNIVFVCLCKSVTDHQIREAVDTGVTSFDGMQTRLSVSTACGSCACEVKRVIEEKLQAELASHVVRGRHLSQNRRAIG